MPEVFLDHLAFSVMLHAPGAPGRVQVLERHIAVLLQTSPSPATPPPSGSHVSFLPTRASLAASGLAARPAFVSRRRHCAVAALVRHHLCFHLPISVTMNRWDRPRVPRSLSTTRKSGVEARSTWITVNFDCAQFDEEHSFPHSPEPDSQWYVVAGLHNAGRCAPALDPAPGVPGGCC
jgi:hypothetical protein